MLELTILILDFVLAIIIFLASIVLINRVATQLNLKLTFKIEKLNKKEIIALIDKDIKLAEANKKFIKGV